MNAWLLKIHRWGALVFALPLLVVIGTGLVLSFEPWLITRAIQPGSVTAEKIEGLIGQHDPKGAARALVFRSYDRTLTIAAGRGGSGTVVEVDSGRQLPGPTGRADILVTTRRMHEALLLDAGWLVIASTVAMLVLAALGVLMGLPRFSNTLSGWHKGMAWGLLPLIVLSPLTGLFIAMRITFAEPATAAAAPQGPEPRAQGWAKDGCFPAKADAKAHWVSRQPLLFGLVAAGGVGLYSVVQMASQPQAEDGPAQGSPKENRASRAGKPAQSGACARIRTGCLGRSRSAHRRHCRQSGRQSGPGKPRLTSVAAPARLLGTAAPRLLAYPQRLSLPEIAMAQSAASAVIPAALRSLPPARRTLPSVPGRRCRRASTWHRRPPRWSPINLRRRALRQPRWQCPQCQRSPTVWPMHNWHREASRRRINRQALPWSSPRQKTPTSNQPRAPCCPICNPGPRPRQQTAGQRRWMQTRPRPSSMRPAARSVPQPPAVWCQASLRAPSQARQGLLRSGPHSRRRAPWRWRPQPTSPASKGWPAWTICGLPKSGRSCGETRQQAASAKRRGSASGVVPGRVPAGKRSKRLPPIPTRSRQPEALRDVHVHRAGQ